MADDGETVMEGRLPVNPSDGLESKDHPIGASGMTQVVELDDQLTGRAGDRQFEGDTALACNAGGFGNCVAVPVLESVGE